LDDSADSPRRWNFGAVTLDERQRELRVGNRVVAIEAKPYELLLVLLRRAGETITKDELIGEIWHGRVVTEGVLTKAVLKLRVAIGDDDQSVIRTVHGYGYRLVAVVDSVATDSRAEFSSTQPVLGATVPFRPNWRYLRKLGRGNSNEVWLGEQLKTHEPRVFKFSGNATQLAALKREITISRLLGEALGGRLDIVRVLDWNLDDWPHFIETEYVEGGSLDEWFLRQSDPSVQTRIEIVARIADALAATHSVGVLHKDLKPGNVLIVESAGDIPGVRLADFGSGLVLDGDALERHNITRLGFTLADGSDTSGTPFYLSPERLAGQVATTRADIYALGVLLYQLLIGDFRQPLAPGWERRIDDELLREDIAFAAEHDPQLRLGDAAELARRLRTLDIRRRARDLERKATKQRLESERASERARIRRRWRGVALATLVAGVVASSIFAWRERDARRDAEQHLLAQESVLRFLREDLLAKADPFEDNGSDPTVRSLLALAHQRASQALSDQPEVAVSVLTTISTALSGLGDAANARRDADAALVIARQSLPTDNRARLELERARADLDSVGGDWKAARNAYLALRPRFVHVFGESHPSTRALANAMAWTLVLSGDFAAAANEYCAVAAENERVLGLDSDLTASSLVGCGMALCRSGQCSEAIEPMQRGIALVTRRNGPDSPSLAQGLFSLALVQQGMGDAPGALQTVDRILAIMQPRLATTHPEIALARHERAAILLSLGRPAEALVEAEAAIDTRTMAFGATHAYVAASRNLRARAFAALGRKDEALAEFDGALRIAESVDGNPELATRIRRFKSETEAQQ
jgi:non-specific serine/threonine protein kinase